MKIALTGNPNSGKTTLFNAITGKIEYVGNWAGVTVEKKEAKIKPSYNPLNLDLIAVDLPGAYSMSPYTSEEGVTKDFIMEENPDVIINVVDSTNLSRSLFFTTQLLELGIPVVIALNKHDITKRKGNVINTGELSLMLHCPVIETCASKTNCKGVKLLMSEVIRHAQNPHKQVAPKTERLSKAHTKKQSEAADRKRYLFVNKIVSIVEKRKIDSSVMTKQDAVDRIIANKYFGIPIFIGVIFLIFSISQSWVGPWLSDIIAGLINSFYGVVDGWMGTSVNPVLRSLLLDGIIGGVGAVLGFLPLIMTLFFCLALLEDCGYMARVAVVMDRYFKKVGLSGRSVIPMVVGTGCAVPGIMATRTIKNERQRRTTALLTPFMPCGAKLPVIVLFGSVFFGGNAWVGTSMYFTGIIIIILGALIIRQITGDRSKSYFIIELPEYRWPSIKRSAISMMDRAKEFIIKAGTIILVCNAVIHLAQEFTWSFTIAENASDSILASLASPFAVLLIPLGFGMWQFAAASITGFIAKENLVGTLAVCFAITSFVSVEDSALVGEAVDVASVLGIGGVAALSYLVFNLFSPPCFAAIGAMNAEMESPKWLFGAIGFQLGMGYTLAFFVYQIGTLITTGSLGDGFIGGAIGVSAIAGIVIFLMMRGRKSLAKEQLRKEAA